MSISLVILRLFSCSIHVQDAKSLGSKDSEKFVTQNKAIPAGMTQIRSNMKDQVSENFTWYRSDLQWDDFISENS